MSSDLWEIAHEQLIERYMEENPDATWEQAYQVTADYVDDHQADMLSKMADYAADRAGGDR